MGNKKPPEQVVFIEWTSPMKVGTSLKNTFLIGFVRLRTGMLQPHTSNT
jgi:hypothetical protein